MVGSIDVDAILGDLVAQVEDDEVTYKDLRKRRELAEAKKGCANILPCAKQALEDTLQPYEGSGSGWSARRKTTGAPGRLLEGDRSRRARRAGLNADRPRWWLVRTLATRGEEVDYARLQGACPSSRNVNWWDNSLNVVNVMLPPRIRSSP